MDGFDPKTPQDFFSLGRAWEASRQRDREAIRAEYESRDRTTRSGREDPPEESLGTGWHSVIRVAALLGGIFIGVLAVLYVFVQVLNALGGPGIFVAVVVLLACTSIGRQVLQDSIEAHKRHGGGGGERRR